VCEQHVTDSYLLYFVWLPVVHLCVCLFLCVGVGVVFTSLYVQYLHLPVSETLYICASVHLCLHVSMSCASDLCPYFSLSRVSSLCRCVSVSLCLCGSVSQVAVSRVSLS